MGSWLKVALGAVLSGFGFAVSLPPANLPGLGWVFLMPLLLCIKGEGAFKGFLGAITSSLLAAWLSTTSLVGPLSISDGDVAWNYTAFGLYGIVAALAVGVAAEVKSMDWRAWLGLGGISALLEGLTYIKLPAHIGLSQFESLPMLSLASVAGLWGVSLLVWLANLSILFEGRIRTIALASATLLGLLTQFVFRTPFLESTGKLVAVIQTERSGAKSIVDLHQSVLLDDAWLVVWPELSVSHHELDALRDLGKSGALVTTWNDQHQPLPHNAAHLFSAAGQSPAYHKRQPFGAELITSGKAPGVVPLEDRKVGLNICFDSCFPWVMRETALAGADVIALPTLDPKSPNGFVQAGHAAFTTFRAAELGLPILRAEASAWSMIVDSYGRISGRLGIGEEGVLARRVEVGGRDTFYKRTGDWVPYLCLVFIAVWAWNRPKLDRK